MGYIQDIFKLITLLEGAGVRSRSGKVAAIINGMLKCL